MQTDLTTVLQPEPAVKNWSAAAVAHLRLLRPQQWIKNTFLFVPLFFAGEAFQMDKLLSTFWGFLSFCGIASSIYILNDYMDLESDRHHPTKCRRPLASGAVSKTGALILFALCLTTGVVLGYFVKEKFLFIALIYFVINLGYSLGLKHISILDVVILSLGFVLRIKAGGVINLVPISQWLMIMVFLLAIFMAVAKRRDDVLIGIQSGKDVRKSIKGYNLEFLNVALAMIASIIIVSYMMYTISPEIMQRWQNYRLYYTTLFVIAGLLRYLQITFVDNNTGSPTRLLYRDRFLQVTLVLWIVSFYTIIYVKDISIFK